MTYSWPDKRVLVTGGTGLVGSWLVKDLVERGSEVTCLVLDADPQSELYRTGMYRRTRVVNGRLEDLETIERALVQSEAEVVIHLGAQTQVGAAYRDPFGTFEANVRGTYNLLEACRRQSSVVKSVVVASSDKAYGSSPRLPYDEETPLRGRFPYDASKSCTDLISLSYQATYGMPVVVARCGNIYGGGDLNWARLVPGTIRNLLRGETPVIRSDGKFTRDYVYVMDAVHAYLTMAENAHRTDVKGEAFNFGPEQPRSVLEVVEMLTRLMGRSDLKPRVLNEAKAEIRDQSLHSEKARRVLGWKPRYTFEQGLVETVAWYKEFLADGGSRA